MTTTIGYFSKEVQEEMYCLICTENDREERTNNVDRLLPITTIAYPDGFTCVECWGSVMANSTVTNRVEQ
jgi:hypothetical protein